MHQRRAIIYSSCALRLREDNSMKLKGLQKLTLLDFPGKVACTVFTGGCNFRCPFCHNSDLVLNPAKTPDISEDEILSFLKKRCGLLDGICISGGEPLLQSDIEAFICEVRRMGYLIKLDTNGSFPERLERLIGQGLIDYAAMDIKSSPEGYPKLIGIENFDIAPIVESAKLLMEGRIPYEFRTTVVSPLHKPEDFEQIGRWLHGDSQYFLQAFVDSGSIIADGLSAYDESEMHRLLEIVKKHLPSASLRGI